MKNNKLHCIGLMSGTSLDGVDLVYVSIDYNDYFNYEIIYTKTYSYDNTWISVLKDALYYTENKLLDLDIKYGIYLGNLILKFINENNIKEVNFISSHGHTILHQPEKGITLQIGNGQQISNITNTRVVCDFRSQDIDLGGQGAPLVPIGDELLFSAFDSCLNLGGFANVSLKINDVRVAFDICPVNTVLNYYSKKLGLDYDKDGKISRQGQLIDELLLQLNSLAYYSQKAPKSLGVEWVYNQFFPILESKSYAVEDVLRTLVSHITDQISTNINGKVLVTGGGAYNLFLIQELQKKFDGELIIPSKTLIEYKEALIFVLLGLLRLQNKNNCLSSVTGCLYDHSSGRIFNPNFN